MLPALLEKFVAENEKSPSRFPIYWSRPREDHFQFLSQSRHSALKTLPLMDMLREVD